MEIVTTLSLQAAQFQDILAEMAAALGCGLLIGLERERNKQKENNISFAGLRSFAISAILGALCFLFGIASGITGALIIGGISLVSLIKSQPDDPGVTTEVAFVTTYFIGALCLWNIPAAASISVVLTILLMGKQSMHGIAGTWITETELRDGIILLALVLIALPLMPNTPLWGPVLNPYVILKLLSLILAVQALAHLAKRLLSSNNALILSSLASGFVSSTALIASLGMEVRAGRANAVTNAGAALMSCVATLVQLLLVIGGTSIAWLKIMLLPTLTAIAVLALWAVWLLRNAPPSKIPTNMDSRMFSLKEAAIIAGALTLIQAGVYGLSLLLGNAGLLAGTLLAALFEIHAAIAAVVAQAEPHSPQSATLLFAIMLGLAAHALAKSINAGLSGGIRYALAFIPAQLIHMSILIGMLWAMSELF